MDITLSGENKFYEKATYDLELEVWKRTTQIEIPFNGKICLLDFYIEDAKPMYTQIKYKIDNFDMTLDQIQSWQWEIYKENEVEQKELFDKYLKNPKDMIHFKELTLATNQIRIIGDCEYYIDFGVGITFDGTIDVGFEEMIYR